jgi:serine/threonine-protein kinase
MQAGQTVRDYVLEAKIGFGGMGEVWRSRHVLLDKLVAIKVVSTELLEDPQFEARFIQEAKAQARLHHPHILPVTEFFREDNRYHLVMPLIDGQSLAARLAAKANPLPLEETLRIAQDVLVALDYAHQQGVIHRDVKHSNILLDLGGHAYLMDFGIALMMSEERRTRTGTSIGTPHYMSPEQIGRPKTLDHRTDVYSFGCVLYEMLAGRTPFDAASEEGDVDYLIKAAHVHRAPEPVRQWNRDVPEAVEAVVMRALEKNPAERFSGCGEFGRALQKAMRTKTQIELFPPPVPPEPAPPLPEPVPLPSPRPKASSQAPLFNQYLLALGAGWIAGIIAQFIYPICFYCRLPNEALAGIIAEAQGARLLLLLFSLIAGLMIGLLPWLIARQSLALTKQRILIHAGALALGTYLLPLEKYGYMTNFGFFSHYEGRIENYLLTLLLLNALAGLISWLILRRTISLSWLWIAASAVGLMFGGIYLSIILPAWLSAWLFGWWLDAVDGAVAGTLQWLILRKHSQTNWWWIPSSAAIWAMVGFSSYAFFGNAGLLSVAVVGLPLSGAQALLYRFLHHKESASVDRVESSEAAARAYRGIGRIALLALIGMLIGMALAVVFIVVVSIIDHPPGPNDWDEVALASLSGGLLPGAIIGGIGSMLERLKYRILIGAICGGLSVTVFAAMDGTQGEDLLMATLVGMAPGAIIGAALKMVARRLSKRLGN